MYNHYPQYPPYQTPPPHPKAASYARAALILGLIAVAFSVLGVATPFVLPLIFPHCALDIINTSLHVLAGSGFIFAGIILAIIAVVMSRKAKNRGGKSSAGLSLGVIGIVGNVLLLPIAWFMAFLFFAMATGYPGDDAYDEEGRCKCDYCVSRRATSASH
jgi:hypothetical protein